MLRSILIYGLVAGVIAGLPLSLFVISGFASHGALSMAVGYLAMLVALSAVFVAIKRRRDQDLGGVIRFWPALALGLGISAVAGVLYVVIWEICCALSHLDFASVYAASLVKSAEARGVAGEALARVKADAEAFRIQYANPLYRWPMSFMEIFPVGVLVSVVSAALLRNSRFLPARG